MVDIPQITQMLVNGISTGSLISLGAVGLTLSYGITKFINFAYGEFLTYGAFTTYGFMILGVPVPISALLGIVFVGALGVGVSRVFYKPLRDRGPIPLLITSIGVALILRSSLKAVAGSRGKTLSLPLIRPFQFGDIFISVVDIMIILVSLAAMVVVYIVLQTTTLGKMMRATSGDMQLARITGIDINNVIQKTWFISAALGAIAGIGLAIKIPPFSPTMGWTFLLAIFAATLLGGIGRPVGAMIGGIVIGLVMSFGTTYLSSAYTLGYAFIVLIAVLLFRPEGILRGEDV